MYNDYWKSVWDINDLDEYRRYIDKYHYSYNEMIEVFQKNQVNTVCDAACGFGANSLILASNGFQVSGFDISEDSIKITKSLLAEYGFENLDYRVASIVNTPYDSQAFEAVAARAVMDHLNKNDFKKALKELKRITRKGGLIYMSFDPLEEDDQQQEHDVMSDGSFLYTGEERKSLISS